MEVIGCDLLPWAVRDVLGKHLLSWWGSLVLSVYGAPSDVIGDVSINARPIDCLSSLCLHLSHPLVCTMEVSEGTVEEF